MRLQWMKYVKNCGRYGDSILRGGWIFLLFAKKRKQDEYICTISQDTCSMIRQ